jgi:hypothetical protein
METKDFLNEFMKGYTTNISTSDAVGVSGQIGVTGITYVNPQYHTSPWDVGSILNPINYPIKDVLEKAQVKDALEKAQDSEITTVIECLERMVTMLEKSYLTDDYWLNAIKHLKYAKAFLDKRMLDKINQTIDGKRNPDREEGEDGQLGHR